MAIIPKIIAIIISTVVFFEVIYIFRYLVIDSVLRANTIIKDEIYR